LLWGSDYPPCLDSLSYPQTLSMLRKMPFFSASDREQIEGGNLHILLARCETKLEPVVSVREVQKVASLKK